MQFMRAPTLVKLNALVKRPDNLSATLITPSEAMASSRASQNILFCKQSISHDKAVKKRTKRHLPKKATSCRVLRFYRLCTYSYITNITLHALFISTAWHDNYSHSVFTLVTTKAKKKLCIQKIETTPLTHIIRVHYEHDPTSFQLSWTKMKQQMKKKMYNRRYVHRYKSECNTREI